LYLPDQDLALAHLTMARVTSRLRGCPAAPRCACPAASLPLEPGPLQPSGIACSRARPSARPTARSRSGSMHHTARGDGHAASLVPDGVGRRKQTRPGPASLGGNPGRPSPPHGLRRAAPEVSVLCKRLSPRSRRVSSRIDGSSPSRLQAYPSSIHRRHENAGKWVGVRDA
jgi:hypothetical protein